MGSELKSLYVLVTRARDSLIIYERDAGRAAPAMDVWEAQKLVRVGPPVQYSQCTTAMLPRFLWL